MDKYRILLTAIGNSLGHLRATKNNKHDLKLFGPSVLSLSLQFQIRSIQMKSHHFNNRNRIKFQASLIITLLICMNYKQFYFLMDNQKSQ